MNKENNLILGLDVSTKTIGIALFEDLGNGGKLKLLTHVTPNVKPKPETNIQMLCEKAKVFDDEFLNNYTVPETLLLEFYQNARRYNSSLRLTGNRDYMSLLVKASLAEQLYGTELKIKLLNTKSTMIARLLELSDDAG